jgi:hypothetical protein
MGLIGFIVLTGSISPLHDSSGKKKNQRWETKELQISSFLRSSTKIPGGAACQEWDL